MLGIIISVFPAAYVYSEIGDRRSRRHISGRVSGLCSLLLYLHQVHHVGQRKQRWKAPYAPNKGCGIGNSGCDCVSLSQCTHHR